MIVVIVIVIIVIVIVVPVAGLTSSVPPGQQEGLTALELNLQQVALVRWVGQGCRGADRDQERGAEEASVWGHGSDLRRSGVDCAARSW
jgi:hypothetical protein